MKVLKKQWLTLLMLASLIVTLTLGVVFMLPAKTASADEDVFKDAATVEVSTEEQLKDEVAKAETTAKKIVLKNDIEMNSITSGREGTKYFELVISRGQKIQLDLAGHTLSVALNRWSNYTIANSGTLSVIDSSKDYQGAVVSNGYISHYDDEPDIYSWYPTQAIFNYGELTVDANIRLNRPESTAVGTDGYYNGSRKSSSPLIHSELRVPAANSQDQTISPATLTINGGNFDMNYGAGVMDHFFDIVATDVYVNGGTFKNSSSTRPNYAGFLANINSIDLTDSYTYGEYTTEQRQEMEVKIKEYRHVDIKITGGDFKDKSLLNQYTHSLLYTFSYADGSGNKKKIDGEGYTILITDGEFAADFSAYTDADHTMVEEKMTQDQGQTVLESYWVVTEADKEGAAATISLNGSDEITGYYSTFDAAWGAAKQMVAESRTIKLNKDVSVGPLALSRYNGLLNIDLNGHTLTITNDGAKGAHIADINSGSSTDYYNVLRFVNSVPEEGELLLVYPEGTTGGGIQLGYATQLVLDGITLRRTGEMYDNEYYKEHPDTYGDARYGTALFRMRSGSYCYGKNSGYQEQRGAFVIIGGKILSDMTLKTPASAGGTTRQGPGEIFAWYRDTKDAVSGFDKGGTYNKFDYDLTQQATIPEQYDKKVAFTIDVSGLGDGQGMRVSWDLSWFLPEGYECNPSGNDFVIAKKNENAFYFANEQYCVDLASAIAAASEGDKTITVLQDIAEENAAVLPEGITLDLNKYLNCTLTIPNLTLNGNNRLLNGTLCGGVTVNGQATFSKLTITGKLTVVAEAQLAITDGVYQGEVEITEGADLTITGGSFDGAQIKNLESYFGLFRGAYKAIDASYDVGTLYSVQLAPDANAQKWYNTCVEAGAFTIKDTDEWNYFSVYVNSGLQSFKGETVTLTDNLNFGTSASASSVRRAAKEGAGAIPFLPAGNATYTFQGSFDGGEHTIENIVAKEKFVGLFGRTTGVTKVSDLTLKNSTFTVGSGYLDDLNQGASGYLYGGAIIGEAYNGSDCTNITIEGVTVDQESSSGVMSGAVVGHSWGNITVDGLNMSDTNLKANWKLGGVVGFTEGSVVLKNSSITDVTLEDSFFAPGVVAGHLSHVGSDNIIENCEIYTPDLNLIGVAYAGEKNITIDGPETYINVYALTGDNAAVGIEVSKEVTEEGVKRTTVITHSDEDNLTFTDEEGNDITDQIEQQPGGGFTATAKLDVSIGGITGETIVYSATALQNLKLSSFVLYDELGRPLSNEEYGYLGTFDVTVNLRESEYVLNSGKHVLLVMSYSVSGDGAKDFNFLTVGNQAFVEVDVQAAALTVRVNSDGSVSYEGFVGGEDESVLGGTLTLGKVDNGDGTYTVTPSGLTSENYNITYVSGIVAGSTVSSESNSNNALWIALAVVGSVVLALGAVTIIVVARKKRSF